MKFLTNYQNNKGLTLIEIILALTLISVMSIFIFSIYLNMNKVLIRGRIYLQILSALQDEIEKIKVMNYEDIGFINGWPVGKLPQEKVVEKNGLQIKIKYYIRNIDDPRDGTINSTPRDLAPADYKLIELEGLCLNCSLPIKKQNLTTIIAPKTVEASTNNGSLFIQVINANGQPVSNAEVNVKYLGNPSFEITDITSNDGFLKLIDFPPGINLYAISVTKNGYSLDKTYPLNDPQNPNPILPHQTVRSQELTTVSFQIDHLSTSTFNFFDKFCKPISNLEFSLLGSKLIGQNPDIFKFNISTTTDQNGQKILNLEWDVYNFKIFDQRYVLKGIVPYFNSNFVVEPNKIYNFKFLIASSSPINLLVNVFDENNNFLSEAQVDITDESFNTLFSKKTGIDNFSQKEWSANNYSEITTGIDIESNPEEIKLKDFDGFYPTTSEWLISKTIDFGTSTNLVYKKFNWLGDVPNGTSIKFQLSANNDNQTWNFIGPDGTENSFFETTNFTIPSYFNDKRYFRYKVFLQTEDQSLTPLVREIFIDYSSSCLSPGSVLFENLQPGNYNLEISKDEYQSFTLEIDLSTNDLFKTVNVNLERP